MAVWIEPGLSFGGRKIVWYVHWHDPTGDDRRWRKDCGAGTKGKQKAAKRAEIIGALVEAGDVEGAELAFGQPDTDGHCRDCGIPTAGLAGIDEYYMVHDAVWDAAGMGEHGMLCIGCLETRLDRQLTPKDFTSVHVNGRGSERLLDRVGRRVDFLKAFPKSKDTP